MLLLSLDVAVAVGDVAAVDVAAGTADTCSCGRVANS